MECPFCGKIDNGVIDSRPTKEGTAIRRRRKCLACAGRFTTYESTPEQLMLLLMRTHAGRGATAKNSEAVLSFMSNALKGLSEEIEKLVGEVSKPAPPKKVKKPKKESSAKAQAQVQAQEESPCKKEDCCPQAEKGTSKSKKSKEIDGDGRGFESHQRSQKGCRRSQTEGKNGIR